MAEEIVTIYKLDTKVAVENIADLRENVKFLKDHLKELEGQTGDSEEKWKDYQKTISELKANQNALKDAMFATSGTFQDVVDGAVGLTQSYNGLVNKMANLKREFRATNDEARRSELGKQINEINTQLKEMDALQGNFQRNVGNYTSAFKNWGDQIDALRKGLGAMNGGLHGAKDATEALAKSPAIATFSILVSVFMKLAEEIKKDEKATESLKKGMDALKPVMDFLSGILDKVVDILAQVIDQVTEFLGSSGLIEKVIKGVMGVGNAIVKFVVSPFKGVIEAIKVFKEQGVKGLGDAGRAFANEMRNGVAFKQNFSAGQEMADSFVKGAKSRKKEVETAGKETGETFAEKMMDAFQKALARSEKTATAWREAFKTWGDALADANKEMMAGLQGEIDEDFQAMVEAQRLAFEQEAELRKKDLEDAKEKAKAKRDLLKGVASATADIFGVIADLYETDEENATKNADRIKNLRIASATIDTISGAIGAFMQASETIPPPYGQIVGAIEAAAITATGLANIAKIKATKVDGGSGNTQSPSVTANASAPSVESSVPAVRSVTSASEEERLNRMASDQRVYILADDIQASQNQIKTRVEESSF